MGNCLDVPEPKARRHADLVRPYRMSTRRPVFVAARPDFVPVVPHDYYLHPHAHPNPGPHYYPHQYVVPDLPPPPPQTAPMQLVVDSAGREYLVPYTAVDQNPYYYYQYQGEPDGEVFYQTQYTPLPNGVKASSKQPQGQGQEESEDVDKGEVKGEARVLRKKSREERKSSQGQENDKVDIMDAKSFASPNTVTTTAQVERQATNHHASDMIATSATVLTSAKVMKSLAEGEISHEEVEAVQEDDPAEDVPTVDARDHGVAKPLTVSFDPSPDHVIHENHFEAKSENPPDDDEGEPMMTSPETEPQIVFSKPSQPVDVVITYSVLASMENDIVRRLSSLLESSGISVWAERLGDSCRARNSDKTAKAILGTKVVVVILSEGSCDQRFIRDHVALATVKDATIFPVTTQPPLDVMQAMPKQLRLQLHTDPAQWTELGASNEDSYLFNLRSLARSIQDDVEYHREKENNQFAKRIYSGALRRQSSGHHLKAAVFWDVRFGHRDSVKWERMQKALEDEYADKLKSLFDVPSQKVLMEGLKKRSCQIYQDTVTKDEFTAVCTHDGVDVDVWEAVMRIMRLEQAVMDVFDGVSTVRHLVVDDTGGAT